jgi:MoaA/NifB/PqqE/SkfB family radical SAM enzyme
MNTTKPILWAEVDERGRLTLPPEVTAGYGLEPGARVRIEPGENSLRLHRPVTQLAKVYVEPTNRCNISCRTCMRRTWDESLGSMSAATFKRIVENLRALPQMPTVFFGGLGEPLFHRRIVSMIKQVKALGAAAELITNGTLLSEARSRELIDSGLDVLWVSIDGATPASYDDVRLGATLPTVLENLARFRKMRRGAHRPQPQIGIAFVAMQRNIDELPDVIALGRKLGATRFSVSNLLPHSSELQEQTLYERALMDIAYMPSPWLPRLSLPKLDLRDAAIQQAFLGALRSGCNVNFAGNNLGGANDVCTFIESGSIAIGWDGTVSPCPPLLHSHTAYLRGRKRLIRRDVIGNVNDRDLLSLWNNPDYVAYRQRVQSFAFAPCTFCGGCELLDGNEEDCLGNTFPACGGCLWAQGIVQCP